MKSMLHTILLAWGSAIPGSLLLLLPAPAAVPPAESLPLQDSPGETQTLSRSEATAVEARLPVGDQQDLGGDRLTLTPLNLLTETETGAKPSGFGQSAHESLKQSPDELTGTEWEILTVETVEADWDGVDLVQVEVIEEPSSPEESADEGLEESPEASEESASPEQPTTAEDSEDGEEPTAETDTDDASESDLETAAEEAEAEAEAEKERWRALLVEGDRLFLQGRYSEAEQVYRQAKQPEEEAPPVDRPAPILDPEQLPPAGQIYWREYQAGLESGMETRIQVPLRLLTEEYPEFIPGHIRYAELLIESEQEEEAIELLERVTALYPDNAELADTRVDLLVADEQWLQAAIAARQFALLNPDDPAAPAFQQDAEDYQQRFRSRLRGRLTRNAIGNVLTGALGFAFTGNLFGPISALETTILMLRGESAVGERIANRAADDLDLIEDETVNAYVRDIGQDLAALAGRSEFEYEFYVVAEDELNAFALPGGKVFVNAGAILRTETEAELAGLIAHELAHAVLSHGFQLVTSGNLTANVLQFVPYGGLATNLIVLRYSRDMERQADALGTRLLATSDYAADGLYRLMITLQEETENRTRFDWLSTHPDTPERVANIESLIERNGYNRYAFEGIEQHQQMRERVERLLREAGKLDEEDITIEGVEEDSEGEEPDLEESPGTEEDTTATPE